MKDFLRRVPLFADLGDDDLSRLCASVDEIRLEEGAVLFTEGSSGQHAYVVRSGEVEITKTSQSRQVLLAVKGPGTVIGEMALLDAAPRSATISARTDVTLLAIGAEQFQELLATSASAADTMFRTVLARWRNTEALLRQSEKMAQIGTLSAGIAHELNNPAAAVGRSVAQLRTSLDDALRAQRGLDGVHLDERARSTLAELTDRIAAGGADLVGLDPLERADREEEIEDRLEGAGLADAWDAAPALVQAGLRAADVDAVVAAVDAGDLGAVLESLRARATLEGLTGEIGEAAARIAAIVKGLKSYVRLDEAPIQDVDVHAGIEDTILILRSKLHGIQVRRDYADDVPPIHAYGSELNQAWTNLIDNAADALDGSGSITIATRRDGDWVEIDIADDGPGIPAEVRDRVFEPFFTTKPPGSGSGLGLDITYNVVVEKHRGFIDVRSEPGRTVFTVRLPVDFTK